MRPKFASAAVLAMLAGAGCVADNSISLTDRISEAAARLRAGDAQASVIASYAPVRALPYTVVLFPEYKVSKEEVVAAGVAKAVADRIYSEMAYLGTFSNVLVVAQEGQRLSFTTSWRHAAEVKDLLVLPGKTGSAQIELRLVDGTPRVVALR